MSTTGISFIFHLIGIVIWLGSALLLPLVIIPAIGKLEINARVIFLKAFKTRFLPLLIAAGILTGLTGWYQTAVMEKNLNLPAIYTKHITILLLIIVSSYIWFYLTGKLIRTLNENKNIWSRFVVFSWIQAGLGVIVLICTGWLTQ